MVSFRHRWENSINREDLPFGEPLRQMHGLITQKCIFFLSHGYFPPIGYFLCRKGSIRSGKMFLLAYL